MATRLEILRQDQMMAHLGVDRVASERSRLHEEKARGLIQQVQGRDYNPPKRERILTWMKQQEFPICPNPESGLPG